MFFLEPSRQRLGDLSCYLVRDDGQVLATTFAGYAVWQVLALHLDGHGPARTMITVTVAACFASAPGSDGKQHNTVAIQDDVPGSDVTPAVEVGRDDLLRCRKIIRIETACKAFLTHSFPSLIQAEEAPPPRFR